MSKQYLQEMSMHYACRMALKQPNKPLHLSDSAYLYRPGTGQGLYLIWQTDNNGWWWFEVDGEVCTGPFIYRREAIADVTKVDKAKQDEVFTRYFERHRATMKEMKDGK